MPKIKMNFSTINPYLINKLVLAAALIIVLILIRAPFLNDVLCGEEGEFAFLVASPVPSAELSHTGLPKGLMGNIGGQQYLGFLSRTIMPYLILEDVVGSVTRPMRIMELSNPDHRAIAIHLIFLSLFLIGCIGAIWIAAARSLPVILVVIWALSTPIAVGSSIQPQLDGTVGVLLLGLTAWILSTAHHPVFLVIAGVLAGLGKHEWAMAFYVAGILTILLEGILIKKFNRNSLFFMLGLSLGVGTSVAMSYDNYLAGFGIMRSFYGEESPLYLARKNFRYLAPTVLIMTVCGLVILANLNQILKENNLTFMLYLGGAAILCGFALSGHNPDLPRYFTPPLVIFIYVFLNTQHFSDRWIKNKYVLYSLLATGFMFNFQYLIDSFAKDYSITTCATTMPNLIRQREMYDEAVNQNKKNQIPVISSGIWLYYPDAFFVEESSTRSGGDELLKIYKRESDFEIIEPMKCQLFPF